MFKSIPATHSQNVFILVGEQKIKTFSGCPMTGGNSKFPVRASLNQWRGNQVIFQMKYVNGFRASVFLSSAAADADDDDGASKYFQDGSSKSIYRWLSVA